MAFEKQALRFREVELSDLGMLRDWRNDPRMASGWNDPRSVQTYEAQVKWYQMLCVTNQAFLVHELKDKENLQAVGMLRFCLNYEKDEARLTGTDVRPDAQGQGYGKRILKAGAEYALRDLGFHRVTAEALETNIAAVHIIRAAGFKPEGTLRAYVWRDGAWKNWHLFSLLREELS